MASYGNRFWPIPMETEHQPWPQRRWIFDRPRSAGWSFVDNPPATSWPHMATSNSGNVGIRDNQHLWWLEVHGWWLVGIENWNYLILSLLVKPLQVDKFGEWISPKFSRPLGTVRWRITVVPAFGFGRLGTLNATGLSWFIIICPIKIGIWGYTDV